MSREPGSLSFKEFRVGERCGAAQPVTEARRKPGAADLDPACQPQLDIGGARRRSDEAARGRPQRLVAPRRHAERAARMLGLGRQCLDLLTVDPARPSKIGLLILEGLEVVIEEDRAPGRPPGMLERQRDQVAKATSWHRVLIGKQPVI